MAVTIRCGRSVVHYGATTARSPGALDALNAFGDEPMHRGIFQRELEPNPGRFTGGAGGVRHDPPLTLFAARRVHAGLRVEESSRSEDRDVAPGFEVDGCLI
jgi:hypothetical protein